MDAILVTKLRALLNFTSASTNVLPESLKGFKRGNKMTRCVD